MRILYAIETLEVGGAEKFTIALANHIARNNEVFLYVIHHSRISQALKRTLDPKIKIISEDPPILWILNGFDSLFRRWGVEPWLRNLAVKRQIKSVLQSNDISIVHSNQFKVDYLFSDLCRSLNIPLTVTIHGDYLNFFARYRSGERLYDDFDQRLRRALENIDVINCISDVQTSFFQKLKDEGYPVPRIKKIYNGIASPRINDKSRPLAQIGEGFVYGMVARGIPEKGWELLIKAFLSLDLPDIELVLVGQGEYLKQLHIRYSKQEHITFTGFVENPADWIQWFDVAVLPTTYASESLPTSVIEYCALGKPVISTDIGEIKNMLKTDDGSGGIVIAVDDLNEHELAFKMKQIYEDDDKRKSIAASAVIAFEKFSINSCARKYEETYRQLLD